MTSIAFGASWRARLRETGEVNASCRRARGPQAPATFWRQLVLSFGKLGVFERQLHATNQPKSV